MNGWRVAKPLVAGLNGAEQSRVAQNFDASPGAARVM
jgi:hypothetical protein